MIQSLYVEEDRLLGEFKKVKDALISASMDDEYFEATKDTCVFLGGKLTEVWIKKSVDILSYFVVVQKPFLPCR